MKSPTVSPLLLSPREASRTLHLCERTLWGLTAPRGPIPVVRIGRSVRYAVDDLQAFVESQRHVATEGAGE